MRAIILAGGRGERLAPLTADRPKCLVDVAGRPIIAHQLHWLAEQGVTQVMVSCGYAWGRIEEAVGDGRQFGLAVGYVPEERPLGRGGGLRLALHSLIAAAPPATTQPRAGSTEPVIACNGDVITRLPLAPMVRAHRRAGAGATLLLVPFRSQHGIVEVGPRGTIAAFREKPRLPYWVSGGVYVLSPAILPELPRRGDHETSTWPRLAATGRLAGYRYSGFWLPIDSPKDVREAEKRLRRRGL